MLWRYTRKEGKLLLIATLLLFSGYAFMLAQSWSAVSQSTVPLTANTIGVFAGVEDNGMNSLALQLDERERELRAREDALATAYQQSSGASAELLYVTFIGLGLLGLILMNFYLDSKRRMSLA